MKWFCYCGDNGHRLKVESRSRLEADAVAKDWFGEHGFIFTGVEEI